MTTPYHLETPSPAIPVRKKRPRKARAKAFPSAVTGDTARAAQLETENSALRRLLADLMLENALLSDRLSEHTRPE